MLDEYLALGGVELGNNARAYAYSQCLSCCAGLLKCPGCDGIHDAVNPWTDAIWEWQTRRVNLFPNPKPTGLGDFSTDTANWSLTAVDGGVRVERIGTGAGRILDFIVGPQMPHNGETVTIRFTVDAYEEARNTIVSMRPDVTSATGEWQLASVVIPAGASVFEVTGPTYVGTSGANSGITLLGAPPLTSVGTTFTVSQVDVEQRATLVYNEMRRNWAVGTGAYWAKTTGTVVKTEPGTATPSVLAATNLMIDPSARNAGVAGASFFTDPVVSGANLSRVSGGATFPGAEYAAHFQVTGTTYRLGFVTGTALAINTVYRVRFRMAGNPTTAADGVTVALNYRPGGAATSGNQVTLGSYVMRATEQTVDATFTTPAAAPNGGAGFFFVGTNGSSARGVLEITEVMLVAGDWLPSNSIGLFFDGETADTTEYRYDWTGVANMSTSTATLLPQTLPKDTVRLTQTVAGNVSWWDSLSFKLGSTTSTYRVPVSQGQTVRVRAQYRGNDQRRVRLRGGFYDSGGTLIGSALNEYAVDNSGADGSYAEMTWQLVAPTNAATVNLELGSLVPAGVSLYPQGFQTGDWLEFRNLQISIDQDLGTFFNGDSLAPDGYTQYRWTGGVQGSPSVELVALNPGSVGAWFDGDTLPAGADPDITRVSWQGAADGSASTLEVYTLIQPAQSTGEPPYDCSALSFAPWYDADIDASTRLAGFYLLSVQGVTDSTMTAGVTEGIVDGGVIGAQRNATRTIRVREMIVGCGNDAAEYGLAWLKAALSESFCGRHGDGCGTSDLDFFTDCPPPLNTEDPDYGATTTRYRRFLHGVGATSGPVIAEQFETTSGAYVIVVEYILTAESPFVWGETLSIGGAGQTITAYDDIPFNLMRYPSGEIGDGIPAVVATQYAFNGSVEFGGTGWNVASSNVPVAALTSGVSTDIAAVGPNSYRVRLLPTATVTDGVLDAYYDVALTGIPAGAKPSVSMWAAALIFAGAPTVGSLSGAVEWRTASASLSEVAVGTVPINGGNMLAKGLTIPATATIARLHVRANDVDAIAADDLRVYADAFALTVP